MAELLTQLADECAEQVAQGLFAQFMALRGDPLGQRAKAQAARDVAKRIRARIQDLTYDRPADDDPQQ
jgi:outer membrane murein-binding lipoprotein Lpp